MKRSIGILLCLFSVGLILSQDQSFNDEPGLLTPIFLMGCFTTFMFGLILCLTSGSDYPNPRDGDRPLSGKEKRLRDHMRSWRDL